jgi:hypothetical protein
MKVTLNPIAFGDLLQALFIHDVTIGHLQRLGVALHLVRADLKPHSPFEFSTGTPEMLEMTADRRCVWLGACTLQDLIILEIPSGRLEVAEAIRVRFTIAVLKKVVFEFRGGVASNPNPCAAASCLRRIERGATLTGSSAFSLCTSHSTSAVLSSQLANAQVRISGTR